jgi:hypothetical protein
MPQVQTGRAMLGMMMDRQFTAAEFRDLKQVYQQENPQATDAQFETFVEENLRNNMDSAASAQEAVQRLKQGSAEPVRLSFPDFDSFMPPKAAPITVKAEGAVLQDRDGIGTRSSNDVQGTVKRAEVTLSPQVLTGVVDQIGSALDVPAGTLKPHFVPGENGQPGRYEIREGDTVLGQVSPDAEGRLRVSMSRLPENHAWKNAAITAADAVGDAATWTAGKAGETFDAASELIGVDPKVARETLSNGLSDAASWTSGKAGELFDGAASLLGYDPKEARAEVGKLVDGASEEVGEWGRWAASQATGFDQATIDRLSSEGRFHQEVAPGVGVDFDVRYEGLDEKGINFSIAPAEITAQGKDLAPGTLADESSVTLRPASSHAQFGPDGSLIVTAENAHITGSSKADSPQAVARPSGPDTVTIDQGTLEVRADEKGTQVDVRDAKGHVEAQTTLTDERIQQVKTAVDEALTQLDDKLKTYGLDRTKLEGMLNQIPSDMLQSLLQSTKQGEVAQTAKNLGIDPDQLNQFVSFLKEQPAQALIRDLQGLTQSLAQDSAIQGRVDFDLKQLSLSPGDQGLLTRLQGLNLSAAATVATPDGTQTEITATGQLDRARLDDAAITAEGAQVKGNATVTPPKQGDPEALSAFRASLPQQNPTQLLTPQGITPGKSGLSYRTVQGIMAKVSDQEWQQLAQGDRETLKKVGQQKNIPPNYLEYMVKYLRDNNMVSSSTSTQVEANLSADRFRLAEGQLNISGADASAKVSATTDGRVTSSAEVRAQAATVTADESVGSMTATGVDVDTTARVQQRDGETTTRVDLNADTVTANNQAVTGQGVTLDGELRTPTATVQADVNGGSFTASEQALAAEGVIDARVDQNNGQFTAQGQTFVTARQEGLDVDTTLDWTLRNQGTQARADLAGRTDVDVRVGKITASDTQNLNGTLRVKSGELTRLAKEHPALAGVLGQLGDNFRLTQPEVTVQVKDGSVQTDRKGNVDYSLQVSAHRVKTTLGEADVSVRATDNGVRGRIGLNPNQAAVAYLNGLIQQGTGLDTQTLLRNGQVEVKFDKSVVSDIVLRAQLKGDHIEVTVDQAKLFGFINAGFVRGEARDALLEQLAAKGINGTQTGPATVRVPIQDVVRQVVGPELAGNLSLSPTLDANNRIQVDFAYRP